jgi:DNA-binding XRE family transcriptional regulator
VDIHILYPDDYKIRKGIPALPFSASKQASLKVAGNPVVRNPKTLGDRIRKRRLELGFLQREVATQIGVSEDCINYWENGRSEPHIHYYPKIIAFLGYYPFPKDESLAGRIKKYRYIRGLTQKQMGKKVGVNGSTICDWENGQTTPKGKYLKRLRFMC